MRIYRLEEARNKERFFKKHSKLTPKQKEELINLYSKQYVPDNIIDWTRINSYSYKELYDIVDTFLKDREEKRNKKNLSKAIEGRDYIKVFENKNKKGTEYLYLPLTWNGSKYLASDHFLPKIKVPSKVMQANDFSDDTAKNEDLSPGAKWCISLWTIPDLVIKGKPITDENGKELRHEGKRYWLGYSSQSYYFLFYFRDYSNLDDIDKKVAFTLAQGSPKIEDITLADDTRGKRNSVIERIQDYWEEHYTEYESQIEHIQEVSEEEYPKFKEYEEQKEKEARKYYNSQMRESILKEYFIYNESTGRYDSKEHVPIVISQYLLRDGEFTVPLGIINGNFDCSWLELKTLRNGPIEVKGSFYCYSNNLTTLEGAPQTVGGSFYCYGNNLTTLEGAPQTVGGSFYCYENELTTLEYSPKKVGGGFYCYSNNLTSLEGAPEEVGGNFNCSKNNLTTLKGAPEEVGGTFNCSKNNLTSLEGAPEKVEGDFYCSKNNLITLEGAPEEVGGTFNCRDNPLQSRELSSEVKGRINY